MMDVDNIIRKYEDIKALFISARDHTHFSLLKKELVDKITSGNLQTENIIITNARHFEALQKINDALLDIRRGMNEKIPGDLIALDTLRNLHYPGEKTGNWIIYLVSSLFSRVSSTALSLAKDSAYL